MRAAKGIDEHVHLYSFTKGQQAIRDVARVMSDMTGDLPLLPGIFPDYEASIVGSTRDDHSQMGHAVADRHSAREEGGPGRHQHSKYGQPALAALA